MNPELLNFIEDQLNRGASKEDTRKTLMSQGGWNYTDIEDAFRVIDKKRVSGVNGNVAEATPIGSTATLSTQSMTMTQSATLLGTGDLLKQAWDSWKNNYKLYLAISAVPAFISILVEIAKSLINKDNPSTGSVSILLIFMFVQAVVAFFGQLALFCAISKRNTPVSVTEAYSGGIKKTFSYIWIAILSGIIVTGGLMFLLIPGLIFSIWFSLGLFILFAEDLRGMNALIKSREYLRGLFGSFVWRTFLLAVASLLISLIIALPFILLDFIFSLFAGALINSILVTIFTAVLGAITGTLSLTFMFMLLENIKQIKGTNLEIKTKKWPFIATGIIGFLIVPIFLFSSLVAPMFFLNDARGKARDAKKQADMHNIELAIGLYHDANNRFPNSLDELVPDYLPSMPIDPSGQAYPYQLQQNGSNYQVCVDLETTGEQRCISSGLDSGYNNESNSGLLWKTYKNNDFGFEFKYPKNWVIVTNFDGWYITPLVATGDPQTNSSAGFSFEITRFKDINDYCRKKVGNNKYTGKNCDIPFDGLDDFIGTENLGSQYLWDTGVYKTGEGVLDGQKIYYTKTDDPNQSPVLLLENNNDGSIFQFRFPQIFGYAASERQEGLKPREFNENEKTILSSFKFTNVSVDQ